MLAGAAATGGAAAAAGVARELTRSDDGDNPGSPDAYRIKGTESAAAAVIRIARTRLDDALGQLREGVEGDAATAIHEARKDLKKTRSVLRLVRDPLGKDRYRLENARLRDAGHALSGTRDATVRLDTLDALAERFSDELPGPGADLRRALEEERQALEVGVDDHDSELGAGAQRAIGLISETRDGLDDWSFSKSGFKLLKSGLERSYRRGHKRFADVRHDPTPENVHEWRKRAKDLWYDHRLLRATWPAVVGEMADQAHELSDLLGDHHDLTVLSDDLGRRSELDGDEIAALQALVEGRQEELLEAAVPIGERLYAEPPKAFVERVHAYWRARDAR